MVAGKRADGWFGLVLVAGVGCGGGGGMTLLADGSTVVTQSDASTDASTGVSSDAGTDALACPTVAAPPDLCQALPAGTVNACSHDSAGHPSPNGYLDITSADGGHTYVCATNWIPKPTDGYAFGTPDQFMSDPQSCCGGPATPVGAPTLAPPAIGYLGALHAPRGIKPQETLQSGTGPIRHHPFAFVVADSSQAAAFSATLASWRSWAGDGQAHPAPDGSGSYYFPSKLLINYVILETADAVPVVVIGPEVSSDAKEQKLLGHPTLGACTTGGGAPLVLIAGELSGTTLNNHSGRYGHDPSVTPEALDDAAALFNCLGIPVTATTYFPAK
jgi:hypothetical protein